MWRALLFLIFAGLLGVAMSSHAATFFDNFDRANGPVGNGWTGISDGFYGSLILRDHVVSTDPIVGNGGIYRPVDYSGDVTVSASISQVNGFGGLPNRFETQFVFRNDGTSAEGYSVLFMRGDTNYADSHVSLLFNGEVIDTKMSTFQFDTTITPIVTFTPDGFVAGTVHGASGDAFSFAFSAPEAVGATGRDFAILQAGPDVRSSSLTYPAVDNLIIGTTGTIASVATLAELSSHVYVDDAGAPGFRFIGDEVNLLKDPDRYLGFHAVAFGNSDKSEIVVAIRGTVPDDPVLGTKTLFSDISFVTEDPTLNLIKSVDTAVAFLQKVKDDNPGARIVLTGQSLGGAIATLLSRNSGLQAVVFDAPGAADLYPKLSDHLAQLGDLGPGPILGFRVIGDQISLVGNQFAGSTTYSMRGGMAYDVIGLDAVDWVHNNAAILSNHDPALIASLLRQGANFASPIEPSFVDGVVPILRLTAADSRVWLVRTSVDALAYLVDPSGSDFLFTEAQSSPYLSDLTLPTLDGIAGYNLRWRSAGAWSPFQFLAAGNTFTFDDGVDGFEFMPMDGSGTNLDVPHNFLFSLTFASAGLLDAKFETFGSGVPEPASWALMIAGFGLLGTRARVARGKAASCR